MERPNHRQRQDESRLPPDLRVFVQDPCPWGLAGTGSSQLPEGAQPFVVWRLVQGAAAWMEGVIMCGRTVDPGSDGCDDVGCQGEIDK
eukprot:3121343-Amphidinium_carterae.3